MVVFAVGLFVGSIIEEGKWNSSRSLMVPKPCAGITMKTDFNNRIRVIIFMSPGMVSLVEEM